MSESSNSLSRHIGLVALTLYGVGDILGAGVYGLVGKAAGQMGNAVWLAFLTSMIAAGLTGLSYASLGSRYPKAGGASYITLRAYNKAWLAYGIGLAVLASGLTSMATATRVFSGYFLGLLGGEVPIEMIIVGFALVLALIVMRGIRESMWANAVCTLIELSGLAIIIIFGARYIGSVDYLNTVTVANPLGEVGPALVLTGAVLTFYSFIGFEDMLNVAEEVKNPKRNLPLGLILAISISSVIYMLISIIAVSAVPAQELATSSEPLVEVVRRSAPWFPSSLYSIIAMFAVSNTALLNFIMGSRLVYGMSKQGLLPKPLSKVHVKRRTPYVAAGVLFVILLMLALSGDISSLAKSTSVLLLVCFIVVNSALIVLKHRKNEPKGQFEVPTIIPVLGILVCASMLLSAKGPELFTAGIILICIAVLYFALKPTASALHAMDSED
ncbi:APC family permease [Bdellovibrio sp. HCB337]|uniref:APC family permease n=1 Tax=Bdellovibrio sp. HCB337 TaxID=3394358 RepID=UPI0039A59ACA